MCRSLTSKLVAVFFVLAGGVTSVFGQIALPDIGVDVAGHVSAVIIALGAIVLVVVGGVFAFLVVKKALDWAGYISAGEALYRERAARGEYGEREYERWKNWETPDGFWG